MRIILKCRNRTNRQFMLNQLEFLSVKQQIYANMLSFIHKIRIGRCPPYLITLLQQRNEVHKHNTRINQHLNLAKWKREATKNNVFYKGVQIYNEFFEFAKLGSILGINLVKQKAKDFVKIKFPLI